MTSHLCGIEPVLYPIGSEIPLKVCLFVFNEFIHLILQKEEGGGEREEEKHQCVRNIAVLCALTGDGTHNPGMCPEDIQRVSLPMTHNQPSYMCQATTEKF